MQIKTKLKTTCPPGWGQLDFTREAPWRGSSSKSSSSQSQQISHQLSTNLILIILIAYFLRGKILLFVFPSLTMLEPGDLCLPSTNIRDTPPYWSVSSALYFLFCTKLYYRKSTRCCLNKCNMKGSALFSESFSCFCGTSDIFDKFGISSKLFTLVWKYEDNPEGSSSTQLISDCVALARPGPG